MRNKNSTVRNAWEVFDTAPVEDAVRTLLSLCDSQEWARTLVEHRPYGALAALLAASDAVFPTLAESEVAAALSGHPRIGERMRGEDTAAQLSRSEQSAMQSADEQVTAQIVQGNQDYEARFDRVFLIRAAERSPREILAELQRRLGNDDASELAEVREQLRQITRLRLEGNFKPHEVSPPLRSSEYFAGPRTMEGSSMTSSLSTHVLDAVNGQPAAGVQVTVFSQAGAGRDGTPIGSGTTDDDGRVAGLVPDGLQHGTYRIVFATGSFFERAGVRAFYPEVAITFVVDEERHYHVPLLLSPFAFSTYRGS